MRNTFSVYRWAALLGCSSLSLFISCGQEEEIKVYRLAKDTSSSEVPSSREIIWTTPTEWEEQRAHGIRTGSFLAKGPDRQNVDISVIFLEGDAGGDLPNVNRWREQIFLPPWTPQEFLNNHITIDTQVGKTRIVDFTSEESLIEGKGLTRIVAAIVPYQEGTWFFKMLGEETLVEDNKPIFLKFLQTVKPMSK